MNSNLNMNSKVINRDLHVKMIRLEIRGQKKYYVKVGKDSTVEKVKNVICEFLRTPASGMLLYHGGTPLNNNQIIGSLPTCVLDLSIPVLGGKVHGSLSRAGKVKANTPKVEKQDKRKRKTGRAKRRLQYNRRFINVMQTFGRRRGPNANS